MTSLRAKEGFVTALETLVVGEKRLEFEGGEGFGGTEVAEC